MGRELVRFNSALNGQNNTEIIILMNIKKNYEEKQNKTHSVCMKGDALNASIFHAYFAFEQNHQRNKLNCTRNGWKKRKKRIIS